MEPLTFEKEALAINFLTNSIGTRSTILLTFKMESGAALSHRLIDPPIIIISGGRFYDNNKWEYLRLFNLAVLYGLLG
jgi:hypothetical protein